MTVYVHPVYVRLSTSSAIYNVLNINVKVYTLSGVKPFLSKDNLNCCTDCLI